MKTALLVFALSVVTLFAPPPNPPPSTPWLVYLWGHTGDYNPAATTPQPGDIATFSFPVAANKRVAFPAFLTTTVDGAVLGDLTGQTITATVLVTVTGNPQFCYGGNTPWSSWNTASPVPANTRLYISTNPAAYDLGDAQQHENDYWWSSAPGAWTVISATTGTVTLTSPFDPAHWSNAQGHLASDPNYTAAFQAAVANVAQIGVAFGGGSFYDVGVAIWPNTGTAAFHLINYGVQ